jgi:hypothetical protein
VSAILCHPSFDVGVKSAILIAKSVLLPRHSFFFHEIWCYNDSNLEGTVILDVMPCNIVINTMILDGNLLSAASL